MHHEQQRQDQHHRQGRLQAFGLERRDLGGHFLDHLRGGGLAIDEFVALLSVHRKITVLSWLRNTRCWRWNLTALESATVSVSRPMVTRSSGLYA